MAIDFQEFRSLASAEKHSAATMGRLDRAVAEIRTLVSESIDIIVVGSYGRGEAAPDVSDFEWIVIYDDRLVAREEVVIVQSDLVKCFANEFGRKRLSINKTFGEVATLSALLTNVGGEADTNQTLTYRMLTLAEGRTLTEGSHINVIRGLARTYGSTHTAGHRLLSLATEIARYWRTLRIDYKFKVDESRKSWALRSVKLRSLRRFWYFSSALHFIAFGPRVARGERLPLGDVERFMSSMGGNPAMRFIAALCHMQCDEGLTRQLLGLYEEIHRRCSDQLLRERLEHLGADAMHLDPAFTELRDLTRDLHEGMARIVISLPDDYRREMIEMFLL